MYFYDVFDTPVGFLTVIADENNLLEIKFAHSNCNKNPNRITSLAKTELYEYFEGKMKDFTVPYKLTGTEFQKKVWNELLKIPYGSVCTYGDIAARIGNKNAARAVGGANNKNKIPIIIPCHRVVSSADIGGFAVGVETKEILLNIEKNNSGPA